MKKMLGLLIAGSLLTNYAFTQETLLTVVDRGNTTPKLIQLTGVGGIPTTGSGLELYHYGDAAVVQGYNRNTSQGIPLVLNPTNANIYMAENGGNIGIGTRTTTNRISFQDVLIGTDPIGLTWYNATGDPTHYGIHRTAGSWNAPDFQQLRLGWVTGVIIDPGTEFAKSYLDVRGNGLRVTAGSVGIGTTTPAYKLDVNGSGRFSNALYANNGQETGGEAVAGDGKKAVYLSGATYDGTKFINSNIGFSTYWNGTNYVVGGDGGSSGGALMQSDGSGGNLNFYTLPWGGTTSYTVPASDLSNYWRVTVNTDGLNASNLKINGNQVLHAGIFNPANYFPFTGGNIVGDVAIGTTASQKDLAVNGIIKTRKVRVTQTDWADYVFDSSYQLASLQQVEKYIQANKHLPEVPSAAAVKKDGLDLGDNQALLLKKIEELTLYIIQQNKDMQEMKQEIKALQGKN